jgi:photosystem II stability/assembly factor-like uncharacterized protein
MVTGLRRILAGLLVATGGGVSCSPAQWMPFNILNPVPTGNTVFSAAALDHERFTCVTIAGEVVTTVDGGCNWEVVPVGQGIFRGLKFLDGLHGWVVGAGSTMSFRTGDGGESWTPCPTGRDTTLYAVDFVDPKTGWAVGYKGCILKTTDGGDSWDSQSVESPAFTALYSVDALNERTAFTVGDAERIYRTADGGRHWNRLNAVFPDQTDLRAVLFTSDSVGFVAGYGSRIARTNDRGRTWKVVSDPGSSRTINAIAFNRRNVGLAVGSSSEVLRSTDGGTSWSRVPLEGVTTLTFYAVTFGSDTVAYIAGSSGSMYKSTDAGATWR